MDGEEWGHLTDAIDLYTHARVQTAWNRCGPQPPAERAALLPPISPLRQPPPPDTNQPGHRPPTR
ncbi:hypothetical protein [Streptomyces bungoensis]|uniref:hypothetical protein n=1 Tax=Streptomyces bungoensis TaxID=285568 RepID=UPI00131BDB41|nr:hypothetical protein [Streptomyces bungoensis]